MHLRLTLDEISATETRLNVLDTCFGRVTEKLGQSLEAGWTLLFGEGLRPFAEKLAAAKRKAPPAGKPRRAPRRAK